MSLDVILKRDRTIIIAALAAAVALAWGYILAGAGTGMPALHMSGFPSAAGAMAGMAPAEWSPGYAALLLAMWWLMMAAMMLPSAAPMILLFAALVRRRQGAAAPSSIAAFVAGYLTVWGGFSVVAVSLQGVLESVALLSPAMVLSSMALGSLLLIGAGMWQLTPAKDACLRRCRSPLEFLATHWRDGRGGAWHMGLAHGAYCLGCCWMLMTLLFYGGVMNVYWIAGLALFVLVEKTAGGGRWIGRLAGIALIAWGGALMVGLTAALGRGGPAAG